MRRPTSSKGDGLKQAAVAGLRELARLVTRPCAAPAARGSPRPASHQHQWVGSNGGDILSNFNIEVRLGPTHFANEQTAAYAASTRCAGEGHRLERC